MKPTYRIKDWDRFFETNESRKVVNARWVPLPNKQDGKGYRRVAQHKNGVAIFCAWTLILQVASKTPVRGILADHDGPLDAEDLAVKTGFPAKIFEQALEFLVDSRVGWLATDTESPALPAEPADVPADDAGIPATPRVEGNGREGNNKEQKDGAARLPVVDVFEAWKERIDKPRAHLTPERQQAISERLQDSTVEEIKIAIEGCRASDFHMGRLPNQPKQYNAIEFICKDRGKLESFIDMAPAKARSKPPPTETAAQRLIRENCPRCFGTTTEVIPGKGGRDCDHKPRTADAGSTGNGSAPQDSEQCVSERSDRHLRAVQ